MTASSTANLPDIGEDGVVSEGRPLILHNLPSELGIRRQPVNYTCIDASQQFMAVGSAQGYVWILELHSSRLLREYSEFKGYSVTVVKLNPVRDYVAYGTSHGFIRVERISKLVSNKCRVQEKSCQSVTTLEWSRSGDDIYCGFSSGRLVLFNVKFSEHVMNHVTLYPEQYGSEVVQLSTDKNSLLVSTLDRAFVLDTDTQKLNQVGRKERKAGRYGGSYLHNGESVLLSRPGMRIWIADRHGNVLSTMAFKEVLSNHHLPALTVTSVPTCPLQYSRSWQFTTLYPWLGGKFVVTYHEDTVFVLDPVNGVLVGACTFQDTVTSVSISGGFLYILLSTSTNKSIVRVAVHHSYVPVEVTSKQRIPPTTTTTTTTTTSASNSPMGSLENLLRDSEHEESTTVCDKEQLLVNSDSMSKSMGNILSTGNESSTQSSQMLELSKLSTSTSSAHCTMSEVVKLAPTNSTDVDTNGYNAPAGTADDYTSIGGTLTTTVGVLSSTAHVHTSTAHVHTSANDALVELSTNLVLTNSTRSDHDSSLMENAGDEQPIGIDYNFEKSRRDEENVAEVQALSVSDHHVSGVSVVCQDDVDGPSNSDTIHNPAEAVASDTFPPSTPSIRHVSEVLSGPATFSEESQVPSTDKEQSRRMRMAQAGEEDIVADNKPSRKKKRRTKGKKLSSAASSRSVSMEMLTDIVEEGSLGDIEPEVTYDASELSTGQLQPSTAEEVVNDGDSSPELDAAPSSMVRIEPSAPLVIVNTDQSADGAMIDNESGQTISNEFVSEVHENTREDRKEDKLTSEVYENTEENHKEGAEADEEDKNAGEDTETAGESEKRSKDHLICATNTHPICSDVGFLTEDVTDNPLYQDTDEELASDRSGEPSSMVNTNPITDAEEKELFGDHAHIILKQHSALQPAPSNPLQDEESLETGTTTADRLTCATSPQSLVHSHLRPLPSARRAVSSWIEVNKKEAYYLKDHRLFEASDSSHESEQENVTGVDMFESQVVDDFYQLCGDLVQNTAQSLSQPASLSPLEASNSTSLPINAPLQLCECQEAEVTASCEKTSDKETWDSWLSVQYPGHGLRCVCLSDLLLWVVTSRGRVYCTGVDSYGRDWQPVKKSMYQIASCPSGHVVWGTYHQNAYVRLGIGMNSAGSTWKNVTKNSSIAHKIKYLAVDENAVWAITIDNRVLFRKGVDERNPEGKVWQEVGFGTNFNSISCCKHVVWALNHDNKVYFRDGITPSSPSGKKWAELKTAKMTAVCLTKDGVVWGISEEGALGFRTGINPAKPGGRGPWWEVVVDRDPVSSPMSSLLQVISADGSHRLSVAVSSLVSLPTHHQSIIMSASSLAGVVILEAGQKLYWCRKVATGYHYTPACKDEVFRFNVWSRVAAGATALWFVRNDGGLFCLTPGDVLKQVEVPSSVELIATTANCLWVISKDMVWSRQGMTAELPEGISFDYIELSTLLHDKKLQSVACGKKVAWGIDTSGVPHFRFGVHAREPGTGMSPAWVPVEDQPSPLLHITVCAEDWLVWACDENNNVYARGGVTVDFPVGRKWIKIPKQKIKELAATCDRVYGLTPSGDLVCRYGISKNNVQGSFWRQLPGRYEHITTGTFGELWTLDNKGQVWKQEWRLLRISDKDLDASAIADPESWEFL